jgi:hypothetical protein
VLFYLKSCCIARFVFCAKTSTHNENQVLEVRPKGFSLTY